MEIGSKLGHYEIIDHLGNRVGWSYQGVDQP